MTARGMEVVAWGMEVVALLLLVAVVRGEEDLATLTWTPVTNRWPTTSLAMWEIFHVLSCTYKAQYKRFLVWSQLVGPRICCSVDFKGKKCREQKV